MAQVGFPVVFAVEDIQAYANGLVAFLLALAMAAVTLFTRLEKLGRDADKRSYKGRLEHCVGRFRELQAERRRLRQDLARVERERDAASDLVRQWSHHASMLQRRIDDLQRDGDR